MLDYFRNNMSAGYTYKNEKALTLGRVPGREFLLVESNGRNSAVRLFWSRGTLYTLTVTGGRRHRNSPGDSQVPRIVRGGTGLAAPHCAIGMPAAFTSEAFAEISLRISASKALGSIRFCSAPSPARLSLTAGSCSARAVSR